MHLDALGERFQMNTNVPGFQLFSVFFSNDWVLSKSVTRSTLVTNKVNNVYNAICKYILIKRHTSNCFKGALLLSIAEKSEMCNL